LPHHHSNVITLCPQLWRAARAWCTSGLPPRAHRRVRVQTRRRSATCRGPRAVCVPTTHTFKNTACVCRQSHVTASTTSAVITRWGDDSNWLRDTPFPLLVLLVLVIVCSLVVEVDGFFGVLVVVVIVFVVLLLLYDPLYVLLLCFRFLLRSFIIQVFRNVLFSYCCCCFSFSSFSSSWACC